MTDSKSEHRLEATRDGSHTVYSKQFDQHFHNPNGAVAESRYVFFKQNNLLDALAQHDHITILEVGFGTGLNLMLLMDYCQSQYPDTKVDYYSVEAYPLNPITAQNLNYNNHLNNPEIAQEVISVFDDIQLGMNHFLMGEHIDFHLFNGFFADLSQEGIQANYIFHDAFSPDTNPNLWTGNVFEKLYNLSAGDVILSTYCAASKVQGAMAWAGWKIAKTQGALGKREMILGAIDPKRLSGHKRINEQRYSRRYEEGDFD
ncbi:tRNA U34 5-methylaminomethyl-2-thiouridine-forming methyltransferase MnmC [Fodinibius salinus]|uniref:tRNA U34 5-methylaminomethyl-2-thiouridine-forming methyltransferase MnmC n=1 Tax=Fodinibius salinus TaxID=860790 RepID=A0A5D3YPG0_9BACT|nr:tRNA (5-methylaminomethyl-2-thiouridine)(34)-methyltransferase MnmD [Fodinibius salinus]TYP94059.1 tRNA U34 5-methylaminomethyl-2-thiouridine-forming methyltransferase MnmC [Fodinibius salinus]